MRTAAAVGAGRAVAFLSRRLRLGGGTTLPGAVAHRIDPHLPEKMASRLSRGSVLITGTNGKTTTSRLLSSILRQAGLRTVHNRSGANLLTGVTSALVNASDWLGLPRGDIGVFELDEAVLPQAVARLRPRAVVVTNLFRDQLDRYGEIDHIARLWRQALASLAPASTAVLNADDPLVASLAASTGAQVVYYGIQDQRCGLPGEQHAADSKRCHACGAAYDYEVIYYGHVGHYACPACTSARPCPAVYAEAVTLQGTAGSEIAVHLPQGSLSLSVPLPGLYNVYNALAALACSASLGIPTPALQRGVESFSAAFGRVERINIRGRQVFLALVKNPVGFNEVLRTLFLDDVAKDLLIVINDNVADGTDVSWLWDVDFELLRGKVRSVVVSGTRAEDMLLRLKYAGVDMGRSSLEKDLRAALIHSLAHVADGQTLYVLPTYTGLLAIRQVIQQMGCVGAFWRD